MKHYILTRFNKGIYAKANAAEWMQHRMDLFDRYTAPSIERQTCKDFTWVLQFDYQTPIPVLDKYRGIRGVVTTFDDFIPWVQTHHPANEACITSRLDNDDYVERDWIEKIQAYQRKSKHDAPFVLDFEGRAFEMTTGKYYNPNRLRPNSMFLSLLEPPGIPVTCVSCEHSHMPARHPSLKLKQYGWVMVCHGHNLINSITDVMTTDNIPQTLYANG